MCCSQKCGLHILIGKAYSLDVYKQFFLKYLVPGSADLIPPNPCQLHTRNLWDTLSIKYVYFQMNEP